MPDKKDYALKTIGETSILLGVKPSTLRYWEEKFSCLRPRYICTHRYYNTADIRILQKIHNLLYQEGYTYDGCKKQLEAIYERDK